MRLLAFTVAYNLSRSASGDVTLTGGSGFADFLHSFTAVSSSA
jgi:hypothetical protein